MTDCRIPVLPVMSTRGWGFPTRGGSVEEFFAGKTVFKVESGTAAIALALGHAGVDSSSEVLIPSYNCRSMREPVWVYGARDVLYAVRPDLTIDLADIQSKLTKRSRAILAPHFFGFPQQMKDIKQLCSDHGLVLIEDCAHVLFRLKGNDEVGTYGDYLIGSAPKFYPVVDGGFLVIQPNNPGKELDVHKHSIKRDTKSLVNCLEASFEYGRLPVLRPILGAIFRIAERMRKGKRGVSTGSAPQVERQFEHIDPEHFGWAMSRTSRVIAYFYSSERAANQRRLNYIRLCQAVSEIRRCRALFPAIGASTIPYMVPVIIEDPEQTFPALKYHGLPMYRWEDCGSSDCPVAGRYSRELIHLPCHEQLTDHDVELMIGLLREHLG